MPPRSLRNVHSFSYVLSLIVTSRCSQILACMGAIETYDSDTDENVKKKEIDSQPTKPTSKKAKKGEPTIEVKFSTCGDHSDLLGEVWHGVLQKMPKEKLTVKKARLVYTAAMRQRWGT
jgi:hypothetical protein